MAKIVILFINVYEGIRKEKIDCTFKLAMFEEFLVDAEVPYFQNIAKYWPNYKFD